MLTNCYLFNDSVFALGGTVMLLIMIEKSWGISRKDGKYRSYVTGVKACRCKEGKLPKVGRSSYEFEISKVGKGNIVISYYVRRRKKNENIYLKRFIPGGYRPMSFDGGYKFDFILI